MRFCYVITAVLIYLVIGMSYALASTLNENSPKYVNQRYGFSLTLPSGHWEASESANGDGAVFRSTDWNVEVRAYGTMGYSVQGMNFDAAIAKESSIFAKLIRSQVVSVYWVSTKEAVIHFFYAISVTIQPILLLFQNPLVPYPRTLSGW